MTVVYLIRHGHVENGKKKRYLGQADVELSQEGLLDAARIKKNLTEKLSDFNQAKWFTSPLKRCRDTAKLVYDTGTKEIVIVDEFKEIDMGSWENEPMDRIKQLYPSQYQKRGNHLADYKHEGGESFREVQERAISSFYEIVETKRHVEALVIVAHAGVNRVILAALLNIDLQNIFSIRQPYGCINQLMYDERKHIWKWNLQV